jgi:hypothetical protein
LAAAVVAVVTLVPAGKAVVLVAAAEMLDIRPEPARLAKEMTAALTVRVAVAAVRVVQVAVRMEEMVLLRPFLVLLLFVPAAVLVVTEEWPVLVGVAHQASMQPQTQVAAVVAGMVQDQPQETADPV